MVGRSIGIIIFDRDRTGTLSALAGRPGRDRVPKSEVGEGTRDPLFSPVGTGLAELVPHGAGRLFSSEEHTISDISAVIDPGDPTLSATLIGSSRQASISRSSLQGVADGTGPDGSGLPPIVRITWRK